MVYFLGLLWGSSSMDSYTLYGNVLIVITSMLIAFFPKEKVRETSSYIVYIIIISTGIIATLMLLLEDFTRKYGINFIVVIIRFIFIYVLVYSAYQYWKFRGEPSNLEENS